MDQVFYNVVNNGLAVSAVAYANIPQKLNLDSYNDEISTALVNGSLTTLAEHIVDYFKTRTISTDIWQYVDDIAFNSIVWGLVRRFQLHYLVFNFVNSLPLPYAAKQVLISGSIIVLSRTAFESLELIPSVRHNKVWRYVFHPSEWIKPLISPSQNRY